METIETKSNKLDFYKPGLNQNREAVISAHFMHEINQNLNFSLYNAQKFSEKALPVNAKLITTHLIPSLLDASLKFVNERVSAAKIRAKENFKDYGLSAPKDVDIVEMIAEVMFDRQFLKGSKSNFSRQILACQINELIKKQKPIKMAIPALPYKSSSPLKSRGTQPDLSEVNFLLGLAELAKTVDVIYQEKSAKLNETMAMFTVICDGSRFNGFLNEPDETIKSYQKQLCWWVEKLQISNYVEIVDYQDVISNHLPEKLYLEKITIRENVRSFYTNLMIPIFDPYNMHHTINKAIDLDPDPETSNPEGRYIPLFKSLIYINRYATLLNYADLHGKNYADLYAELTRHIFEPYTTLTDSIINQTKCFILNPLLKNTPTQEELFEFLRQSMLWEAWNATIDYLAEIRSDRDLDQEPIITCLPDHIRWTIHAKPGQLAILTTTAYGDPVQPWHGVGVFKLTKNNKIKLYTLPILSIEGMKAIPIVIVNDEKDNMIKDQPLFYVHPEIEFENISDLLIKIKRNLTRKRKL